MKNMKNLPLSVVWTEPTSQANATIRTVMAFGIIFGTIVIVPASKLFLPLMFLGVIYVMLVDYCRWFEPESYISTKNFIAWLSMQLPAYVDDLSKIVNGNFVMEQDGTTVCVWANGSMSIHNEYGKCECLAWGSSLVSYLQRRKIRSLLNGALPQATK